MSSSSMTNNHLYYLSIDIIKQEWIVPYACCVGFAERYQARALQYLRRLGRVPAADELSFADLLQQTNDDEEQDDSVDATAGWTAQEVTVFCSSAKKYV